MVILMLVNLVTNISLAFQGEIQIPASHIGVEDSVEISLIIEDAILSDPPLLKVGFGLEIQFKNQSHISEIVYRKGNSRRVEVYTYTYQLKGKEEGLWYITAPVIQVGQRQLSIESQSIQVDSAVEKDTSEVILTGTLLDETPFEGEVVPYEIKYSKRISLAKDELIYPSLTGFREITIDQPITKDFRSEVEGYIYHHHHQRLFFQQKIQ